jgi:glutathione peroxidase
MSLYDYSFKHNSGEIIQMSKFKNSITLIVNVASKCGFTNQYSGLQMLQDKFESKGFNVIAFPCNQFGGQEPGSDFEIKEFCQIFNPTFYLASKIDVNGENADPFYKYLKNKFINNDEIKWNFEKFLILQNGEVKHFDSQTSPEYLKDIIESYLE